ncbi:MAG: response regulator [Candidatus Marinimicrobia bacterium]|nr:response regulator [Candidatus Neomarinimicrobiota bacterium]
MIDGKKILIIDDEESFVDPVIMFLEKNGAKAVWSKDGLSGLKAARSENPDLILLDLMLPGMNGFQVCRLLKFDEKYNHIPVLILSAKDSQEDINLGMEGGCDEYITKPLDFEELIHKINKYLR